jgi:hypothetical protein
MRAACLAAALLGYFDAGWATAAEPRVIACDGGEAAVTEQAQHVLVRGPCLRLEVGGSDNDVDAEVGPGAEVHVGGSRNHVLLRPTDPDGDDPVVTPEGIDNEVALAAPLPDALPAAPHPPSLPAPAPAPVVGAVVLDGDGANRMVPCAGRDVLIHANDGRFRLSGGCRSVTVDGDRTLVEAELRPGGRIAIGGRSVRLEYILIEPGPEPTRSVSGRGSEAVHVPHLVSILGPAPH